MSTNVRVVALSVLLALAGGLLGCGGDDDDDRGFRVERQRHDFDDDRDFDDDHDFDDDDRFEDGRIDDDDFDDDDDDRRRDRRHADRRAERVEPEPQPYYPPVGDATLPANDEPGAPQPAAGITPLDSRQFLIDAALMNLFVIESARVALAMGVGGDTRDAAEELVRDHSRLNDTLGQLARAREVNLPDRLLGAEQARLDELRRLRDDEFVREFHLEQFHMHDDALKLFERGTRELNDSELRSFAGRTLPTWREHREDFRRRLQ